METWLLHSPVELEEQQGQKSALCLGSLGKGSWRAPGRREGSVVRARTVMNSVLTRLRQFTTNMLIKMCEQHWTVSPSCVPFICLYRRHKSHLLKDLRYSSGFGKCKCMKLWLTHRTSSGVVCPFRQICAWLTTLSRCYSVRKIRKEEVMPQNKVVRALRLRFSPCQLNTSTEIKVF